MWMGNRERETIQKLEFESKTFLRAKLKLKVFKLDCLVKVNQIGKSETFKYLEFHKAA